MSLKIFNFKDTDHQDWDHWVDQVDGSTYLHTSSWLKYISEFYNVIENASFCVLKNKTSPLAICPLVITKKETENGDRREIGGNGLSIPALFNLSPREKKRILNEIFQIYSKYAEDKNIDAISLIGNPLTNKFCADPLSGVDGLLELERYHLLQRVVNTVVIDLDNSSDILFQNMGKYHRRHIKRAPKKGVTVKTIDSSSDRDEINAVFSRFQNEHFKSAGRLTRPQKTWDNMKQMIEEKKATLFVSHIDDIELSYLFCGQYKKMAFGWSQVNVKEFEQKYSPRHILEWEAICYYQSNGYRFYEVGDRYWAPTPLYTPTNKEISIGVFKERYGGMLLPKVFWVGYFKDDIMKKELTGCFDTFTQEASTILT